jgi:hypothetical protein
MSKKSSFYKQWDFMEEIEDQAMPAMLTLPWKESSPSASLKAPVFRSSVHSL